MRNVQKKIQRANHAFACEIMGKNMLGISEVEQHFGKLTDEQRQDLNIIPFTTEILKACATTHILVADVGISIVEIRAKTCNERFYNQNWFKNQKFANQTDTARWRLVRKTPVDDSFSKDWTYQRALINNKIEEVPSARQVVYMTILNYFVTGERLFEKSQVRTSDTYLVTHHVRFGLFTESTNAWYKISYPSLFDEFFIDCVSDHSCQHDVGLASARKPVYL